MTEPVRIGDATLYLGDVLTVLREMPDESVHCVVCSPPYWGLRDYGTGTWEGGSAECDHVSSNARNDADNDFRPGRAEPAKIHYSTICSKCSAHRIDQQIGLEATPEEYVAKMVTVFREVRRVLRSDGTCWINLGDSFSDKQLQGIPWRVAFALQADGWYLRSDIIWAKPNPMPESVTDRPTKAHEYIFLLSKSAKYFYDADAVRESHAEPWRSTGEIEKMGTGKYIEEGINSGFGLQGEKPRLYNPLGRNRRTVWTIATEPFPGAHFATYPRKLVEPCILAGCPRKCCPACGAPWEKEIEHIRTRIQPHTFKSTQSLKSGLNTNGPRPPASNIILSEHPTCACDLASVPGTVLDPFLGSGTTLVVALTHGRRGIGIELKKEYFEMACNRLRHGTVDPEEVKMAEKQFELSLDSREGK